MVRIEDVDPPREVPGSADSILADLDRLGMASDEQVLYQSSRADAYDHAIDTLLERGDAYWCGCSRSELPPSGIYPGTCREGLSPGRKPRSVRVRTNREPVIVADRLQGNQGFNLNQTVGDFVVRRADGLPAYQLAVTVDDSFQKISDIVRGADLLDSTPRQIFLQQQLGFSTPGYAHIPMALGSDGAKLSKRSAADPVKSLQPADAISTALKFLGHKPPLTSSLNEIWTWAAHHWNMDLVPRKISAVLTDIV